MRDLESAWKNDLDELFGSIPNRPVRRPTLETISTDVVDVLLMPDLSGEQQYSAGMSSTKALSTRHQQNRT